MKSQSSFVFPSLHVRGKEAQIKQLWVPVPEFPPALFSAVETRVCREAESRFLSRLQTEQAISRFLAFFYLPKGYKGMEQAMWKLICISIKTRFETEAKVNMQSCNKAERVAALSLGSQKNQHTKNIGMPNQWKLCRTWPVHPLVHFLIASWLMQFSRLFLAICMGFNLFLLLFKLFRLEIILQYPSTSFC